MAIKVNGTTVIDDSRQLTNIASIDTTTKNAFGSAGVGGVTVTETEVTHPTISSTDENGIRNAQSSYTSDYDVGTVVSGYPTYYTTLRTFDFNGLASFEFKMNTSTNYSTSTGPFFSSLSTTPGNTGYSAFIYAIWFYDSGSNTSKILRRADPNESDGNNPQSTVTDMRNKIDDYKLDFVPVESGDKILISWVNGYYWGGSATFKSTFGTYSFVEVE